MRRRGRFAIGCLFVLPWLLGGVIHVALGGPTPYPGGGTIGPGTPVSATAPTTNQILKFDGTAWTPATDSAAGITFPASFAVGDVLYASAATTVAGRADVATGYVLASGGVAAAPSYVAPGGDIAGAIGAITVGALQGRTVSNAAPAASDVLAYVGGQWAPTQAIAPTWTGTHTFNGPIAGGYAQTSITSGNATGYVLSPSFTGDSGAGNNTGSPFGFVVNTTVNLSATGGGSATGGYGGIRSNVTQTAAGSGSKYLYNGALNNSSVFGVLSDGSIVLLGTAKIGTSTTVQHTVPGGTSDTFALLTASQTFANKTLTTPLIGDFTNATHTHASTAQGGTIAAGLFAPTCTGCSGVCETITADTAGVTAGKVVVWTGSGKAANAGATVNLTTVAGVATTTATSGNNSLVCTLGSVSVSSSDATCTAGALASSSGLAAGSVQCTIAVGLGAGVGRITIAQSGSTATIYVNPF